MSLRTALAVLAGIAGMAQAQTQSFPFQIQASTTTTSQLIANGGQIVFLAEVGKTQTVHIVATYQGNGQVVVSQLTQTFGSTSFKVVNLSGPQSTQKLPFTLNPQNSLAFDIVFSPTSALQVSATINQPFSETAPASGGTLQTTQNQITLNAVGTAPQFAFSYTLQSTQNVTPIQPGGTITFPATLVNTSAQASFNITNIGSGAGQITNITQTSGTAFKLQAVPLFPFPLPANAGTSSSLQVLLVYTPSSATASDTGQIQVTYGSGTTVTFNLQGSGSSSTFTYTVIQGSSSTTVLPNGTITLANTNIGSTSSAIVKVQNTGSATGTVNSVSVTGQGYQLVGVPLTPPTLAPNASFTFSINFTPTQPGPVPGELAVGSDLFTLAGNGLGPQLGFSYVSGGTTITLGTTNPSLVFSPTQISQSQQLTVQVTNNGTLPATVSNLSIGEAKSPFSISGQPSLPTTINPGSSFPFNVIFTPVTDSGTTQGTLLVNTTVIALSGSGTAPPPLPAYTFQGASGNVSPQSQPEIGLELSSPYPVALTGTLTLTTAGNLPTDTAVQFVTGGRTVPFVIPANTTAAQFAGEGAQVFLQSGTVAETITLTPDFTTQAGGVDLTPTSPPTVELTIAPSAPTLISVQLASATSNGFTLTVVGYSTTRTLTALNVTFTAAAGFNVPSVPSIDLTAISPLWFQSTAAQSFGGLFSINIPFTLQGTVKSGQTLLQTLASAAVTVSNEVGTSNSVQTPLQ